MSKSESCYERIDRLERWGFVGLIIAGCSPFVGSVVSGWIGWPMLLVGMSIIAGSMISMKELK